jgi:hypothetical protein
MSGATPPELSVFPLAEPRIESSKPITYFLLVCWFFE